MSKECYILAHDVGTSGNKAAIVTPMGDVVGTARSTYEVFFPKAGWAEQNPRDWWEAICKTTREVLATSKVSPSAIAGICLTGQMAGCVPVDKDGNPTRNAISWLDTRSKSVAKRIGSGGLTIGGYNIGKIIKWLHITGGGPSLAGKDFTTQALWIREEEPAVWKNTAKFLSVKGYLIFQSTGKFVITHDDANLTWFMDTRKNRMCWSESLLTALKFPQEKLPNLIKCTDIVGPLTAKAAQAMGMREGIPVIGGGGDIITATVGSGAVREMEGHIYIGTSDWVTVHVEKRRVSPTTATGSICSAHPNKYIAIAEQEVAGAALEWAQNQLYHAELLKREEKTTNLYEIFDKLVAQSEPGAMGLYFLPWMFGERVPLDNPTIRGGLVNLSLTHHREHIIRAVFEGIALNIRWALWAVENKITKHPFEYLKFGGGGAKSDIWCQILADVTQRPIWRMKDPQSVGARGAALIASFALGFIKDYERIADIVPVDQKFAPRPEFADLYDRMFANFKAYYKANKEWYKVVNKTVKSSDII